MSGWETYVRKVEPYVPGEQPKRKVIKLNTNENPYPPSPRVQKVLDGFDAEELRLYPDPEAADLIEAIALEKGLSKDQIFVGVGSDDVLAMSFLTLTSLSSFRILPILFMMSGQNFSVFLMYRSLCRRISVSVSRTIREKMAGS